MKEGGSVKLYTFKSGERCFAVPAESVKEVKDRGEISAAAPLFHAGPKVAGFINIRGEIHLALDFRRMTGEEGDAPAEGRDLIVFKESEGPSFGILVDKAGDIFEVAKDAVEPWSQTSSEASGDFLRSALCKSGDKLVSILDPRRFLSCR